MAVVGVGCVGLVGVLDIGQAHQRLMETWDRFSVFIGGRGGNEAHHLLM